MSCVWIDSFTRYLDFCFLHHIEQAQRYGKYWYIPAHLPWLLSERFHLHTIETHLYEYRAFANHAFGHNELEEADALFFMLEMFAPLTLGDEYEQKIRSTKDINDQQHVYTQCGVVSSFETFGYVFQKWLQGLVYMTEVVFQKQWGYIPTREEASRHHVAIQSLYFQNEYILYILSGLWKPSQVFQPQFPYISYWYPYCARTQTQTTIIGNSTEISDTRLQSKHTKDHQEEEEEDNLKQIDTSDIDQWDPLYLATDELPKCKLKTTDTQVANDVKRKSTRRFTSDTPSDINTNTAIEKRKSRSRQHHRKPRTTTTYDCIGISKKWWDMLSTTLQDRIQEDRHTAGYMD